MAALGALDIGVAGRVEIDRAKEHVDGPARGRTEARLSSAPLTAETTDDDTLVLIMTVS